MNDKFNRVVATGLIAVMLASLTSCDGADVTVKLPDGTQHDVSISGPYNPEDWREQDAAANAEATSGLKGSVWDACKERAAITYEDFYALDRFDFRNDAIPLTFLQGEGLLYIDDYGIPTVNGKQQGNAYYPFQCVSYVDNNTDANDVYLLLEYRSDYIDISGVCDKNTFLATWLLRYNLDDDDYQTFLKLDGNHRMPYFIQEMDKQYQPETIIKTVVGYGVPRMGGIYNSKGGFPYLFVANIDYANNIMTYGAPSKEGIKYYDLTFKDIQIWNRMINDGYTEEEILETVKIKTKPTVVGECLDNFTINGYAFGVPAEVAKEKLKNTDRIHELVEVNINTNQYSTKLSR